MRRCDPCRSSRRTSLPSLGDTVVSSPVYPHSPGRRLRFYLELVSRAPAGTDAETGGSPKFPGNPRDPSPCSPTPAGPGACLGPIVNAPDAAPAPNQNEGSPHCEFRGSITRLWAWLSTPREGGRPHPRKTHFRLLAPALPDGIRTRRVSTKGFQLSLSSFPELLGARFVSRWSTRMAHGLYQPKARARDLRARSLARASGWYGGRCGHRLGNVTKTATGSPFPHICGGYIPNCPRHSESTGVGLGYAQQAEDFALKAGQLRREGAGDPVLRHQLVALNVRNC